MASSSRFLRRHPGLARLALALAALTGCGFLLELGIRVLDPYPYVPPAEVNRTQHGNLSEYDAFLGWKGVPAARELLVTPNARVLLEHNRQGFRDLELEDRAPRAPAIVFLGDSFTWGYEVAHTDMFVNLLRRRLAGFEVFNLAHRGYGTDQSLLTFRSWQSERHLALVVLAFCENDIWENNSREVYRKAKPKFAVVGGELSLRNVPVPRVEAWDAAPAEPGASPAPPDPLGGLLLRSHLVHDLSYRLHNLGEQAPPPYRRAPDLELTARLLEALRDEAHDRGAPLQVVAIPTKDEIQGRSDEPPYQESIARICARLDVAFLDLGPAFRAARLRTYFREGMHWTARGHAVAADAIWSGIAWPSPESDADPQVSR